MRIVRTLAHHRALRVSDHQLDVVTQSVHADFVRVWPRADCHVTRFHCAQSGQELETHELAKPSLHAIASNRAVLVSRNHDRDPCMTKRGSEDSDVEVRGPNPPPLSNDILNV